MYAQPYTGIYGTLLYRNNFFKDSDAFHISPDGQLDTKQK